MQWVERSFNETRQRLYGWPDHYKPYTVRFRIKNVRQTLLFGTPCILFCPSNHPQKLPVTYVGNGKSYRAETNNIILEIPSIITGTYSTWIRWSQRNLYRKTSTSKERSVKRRKAQGYLSRVTCLQLHAGRPKSPCDIQSAPSIVAFVCFYLDSFYRFRDTLRIVFGWGSAVQKISLKVQGVRTVAVFVSFL